MNYSTKRILKGFLLAPLAPAIVIYIITTMFLIRWGFSRGEHVDIFLAFLLNLYYLVFVVPVCYLITFVFGIPAFLVYKKFNITNFSAYVIGSGLLGFLSFMIPVFLLKFFDAWEFSIISGFIGAFLGAINGSVFWQIVYKNTKFEKSPET